MRRLVSQGEASVHDTTPAGRTLLHFAAGNAYPEMCHWLLENGADGNAINIYGEIALHTVGSWTCDNEYFVILKWGRNFERFNRNQFYQTARELVEFGQNDPLALSAYGVTPLHKFGVPMETLRFMVAQQQVFHVDLENSQLGLKLAQHLSSCTVGSEITERVRFLLGDGPIPPSAIQRIFKGEMFFEGTLLTHFARRSATLFQFPGHAAKEFAFMSDLIQGGANVHELHELGATCLDLILMTWPRDAERNKRELLLGWLKCLHISGIDLQDYFWKE